MLPLVFIETVSAAVMTVPAYAEVFRHSDAAGVLFEIFRPWGAGGKFIMVRPTHSDLTPGCHGVQHRRQYHA
jgi:hypothetical protein